MTKKINKKAGALSIIVWVASVVVIIFFLAGWYYAHNLLTNALLSIPDNSKVVNLSYAVQSTFVPINNAMTGLQYISFILIAVLAFSILIENFYIRRHPILFFVHILIVIVSVVASLYISNEYESLMNQGLLSTTLTGFKASSFVALNLPFWVAGIGIFGLILLFINALRDPEIRGSAGI